MHKFETRIPDPLSPMLSPDEAVVRLRALDARIPDTVELSSQEREALRNSMRISEAAIQASISVLDASDEVARFVGPPADVRELCETTGRWRTFENELKAVLQRVHDANIVRHQRLRLLAAQAYLVGRQVARTPGNAGLLVHLDEVKRLRARRRRKAAAPPEAAAPASSEVVREVTGQVIEELPLGAV